MNRILPPTSKIVRMVSATRVEYAAFRKLSSLAAFAAPAGIFAFWCLDPTVRHHIAPGLVADPNAAPEEEQS